jgi:hypothetical protein
MWMYLWDLGFSWTLTSVVGRMMALTACSGSLHLGFRIARVV